MNFVGISGNLVADAKVFPTNNGTKVIDSVAVNDSAKTSFIPIENWTKNKNSLKYLKDKLLKGKSIEVLGKYSHRHFKKDGKYAHVTDIKVDDIKPITGKFSMNTATVTGEIGDEPRYHKVNDRVKICFTVVSYDKNYRSLVQVENWVKNPTTVQYFKRNAHMGTAIEIPDGKYHINRYKDKDGLYQDNSDIITDHGVELGYKRKQKHYKQKSKKKDPNAIIKALREELAQAKADTNNSNSTDSDSDK